MSGDGGVLDGTTESQPVAPEAKVPERSGGDSRKDQGALNPGYWISHLYGHSPDEERSWSGEEDRKFGAKFSVMLRSGLETIR